MTMSGDDFSFGALLQTFRKRKHLTQQGLAESLGVHRRTLMRWEQGDYLPESKAMVLELARHLKLSDQEARQLLEASLTALSPYWFVPFSRNPYFTGREEILEALHTQLNSDQSVALTQSSALQGLGGVGKTQIALEYAYRHALEYNAVFWIRAETEEQILSSLLCVAEVLQLPGRDDRDQHRVIAAVQHWLVTHNQWLLIWDNVEDVSLLNRFLPASRPGAVLITTRYQALGTLARGIDILPMEPEEGRRFLLHRAKVLNMQASDEQIQLFAEQQSTVYNIAGKLVNTLGCLPLALDQAAAYIEETGCSVSDYLCRYEQQPIRLLDRRGNPLGDHPQSVTATIRLAIQQVECEQQAAIDILWICVLLHAESIPEELFLDSVTATDLGPEVARFSADPTQFDAAIAALRKLSLIQRHTESHTLSLHRLVQAVLKAHLSERTQHIWMICVLRAMSTLFPTDDEIQTNYWHIGDRLLPHAIVCLEWSRQWYEHDPLRIALMNHVASYMRARTRFAEAEALYLQALSIGEQFLGPEHLLVAETLDGLAYLRRSQMHYEEAEALFQRALAIRERAVGKEHPLVAESLHNLANFYWRQGKYSTAETLRRQVLQIRERTLEADHPKIAAALNNLATIYYMQGKYEEVEVLFQRALAIRERTLGTGHPRVAESLHNLAAIYLEQGKYEAAEPFFQRALHIWEQELGPEDLDVAYPLTGLAELYRETNRYEVAEMLFQRAIHINEQGLGLEHPRVAEGLHGLAVLYMKQGEDAQAEPLYTQALSIREQRLGPCHPETAHSLHDFARFRQKQGLVNEAIAFAERALPIRTQIHGTEHPETMATSTLYTQLCQEQATMREGEDFAPSIFDPCKEFFATCCEFHPLACCRSADLWQAYQQWTAEQHERYSLSRRAFIAQLKTHGCRADRTKTARIWRGIALVRMCDDGR